MMESVSWAAVESFMVILSAKSRRTKGACSGLVAICQPSAISSRRREEPRASRSRPISRTRAETRAGSLTPVSLARASALRERSVMKRRVSRTPLSCSSVSSAGISAGGIGCDLLHLGGGHALIDHDLAEIRVLPDEDLLELGELEEGQEARDDA